ncbi:hypothetical protein JD844_013826 [Phrynosoma platyrhinos]|uniref:Uncharacterized protein n=1 Tax=Phrynosoma platyrhinos TaxID=52577 RepID=A0ABQ7TME5_PHRPL|nr:hypothetical protein JD844_013826 [Phrynosoma platyrhinos]
MYFISFLLPEVPSPSDWNSILSVCSSSHQITARKQIYAPNVERAFRTYWILTDTSDFM